MPVESENLWVLAVGGTCGLLLGRYFSMRRNLFHVEKIVGE
jgi:hypothetical protein